MRNGSARQAASRESKGRQLRLNAAVQEGTAAGAAGATPDAADGEGRRMLLEMATGGPNMPKGGHASDLARLAKSDALNICGPRSQWQRKEAEFGSGAYSEEPWSLQAMEKRVYALRDFYKEFLYLLHF